MDWSGFGDSGFEGVGVGVGIGDGEEEEGSWFWSWSWFCGCGDGDVGGDGGAGVEEGGVTAIDWSGVVLGVREIRRGIC